MIRRVVYSLILLLAIVASLAFLRELAGPRVDLVVYSSYLEIPVGPCGIEQLKPRGPISTRIYRPPGREWVMAAFGECGLGDAASIGVEGMTITRGGGFIYNDMVQEYFGGDALGQVRFSDTDDAFRATFTCDSKGRRVIHGALGGAANRRYFFVEVSPLVRGEDKAWRTPKDRHHVDEGLREQ